MRTGTIGRYQLLQKLHHSERASLWLAEDSLLRRRVVLELLVEGAARSEGGRLGRKSGSAADFSTVLDAGEHEGRVYIAYRLAEEEGPSAARGAPTRESPRRRYGLAAGLLGGLVVLGVAGLAIRLADRGPTSRYDSVAVLPLANVGGETGEGAMLAGGVSEMIATKLAGVEGLRVSPWLSSQRYSTARLAPKQICEELNVDALVTGEIRLTHSVLSGAVALVDENGEVWSQAFEEPVADFFRVQSRISVGIARALRGRLGRADRADLEHAMANSVEAYRAYLEGAALLQVETFEANRKALARFERALDLDPEMAVAYVGMGAVYGARYAYDWELDEDPLAAAGLSFQRALELDPGNVRAIRGLNNIRSYEGKWRELLEYARDAGRSGDESIEVLLARAQAYWNAGLPSAAVPLLRRVLELDPVNEMASSNLTYVLQASGQHEEALRAGEAFLTTFPEDYVIHLWMGHANEGLGRIAAARAHYERGYALCPPDNRRGAGYLAAFLCRTGELERAREIRAPIFERARRRLEKDPDDWNARLDYADGLEDPRPLVEEVAEEILRSDERQLDWLMNMADICATVGLDSQAARFVRRSLEQGIVPERFVHRSAEALSTFFQRPENAELWREYQATVARMKGEYGS